MKMIVASIGTPHPQVLSVRFIPDLEQVARWETKMLRHLMKIDHLLVRGRTLRQLRREVHFDLYDLPTKPGHQGFPQWLGETCYYK